MKEYKRLMGQLILVLNRGILSREDETAVIEYMRKHPDLTLPDKYCKAIEGITELYPRPTDFDVETGRLWDAGYQIGYISAMADVELWWNLHQAKIRQAAISKRKEKFGPKHERMASQYDDLVACDLGDLEARKTIAEDEGMRLSSVNRVLKKLGRL